MSIDSIEELVSALDECSSRRDYVELAAHLKLSPAEVGPYSSWSKDQYTRNCVARTDDYELLLLCWEKDQDTPIHCHGGEECWVHLVDGEITEDRFAIPDNETPELEQRSIMKKGDVSYMNDEMGVHRLHNTGDSRAMSLHLYVKPIDRCRIFDDEDGSMHWKELEYDTVDTSVSL